MKPNWSPTFRYIVLVVMLILLAAIIWYIRELFQPLMMAMLIAYFFSPLVNLLAQRTRLKRKVAANIVYFTGMAMLVAMPSTFLPPLLGEAQGLMADFNATLDQLQTTLTKPYVLGGLNFYLGGLIPALRTTVNGMIIPQPEQALQILESTSRGFLWFLVIVVTTYNLMTEWDKLRDWLLGLVPDDYQEDAWRLYTQVKDIWLGYLGGQVRLILILAVIYSAAWAIIGVRGAIVLGILAGFLNLLPEVGPLIAAVLAVLVAWLEGSTIFNIPNGWFALLAAGVYFILNNFKTIYLQPRILGQSVFLHEGVVFLAIIAAIVLQGMLGVLVVVPLLASVMVLGRYIRRRLVGLPPFDEDKPQGPEPPVKTAEA